jgi:hypothetical protein
MLDLTLIFVGSYFRAFLSLLSSSTMAEDMSREHIHIQLDSDGEEEIDSIHLEKKSKDKATHKPAELLTGNKRQHRLTSSVWVHFDFLDEPDENGNLMYKCKKCGNNYNVDSKMGTGNLHRHVAK